MSYTNPYAAPQSIDKTLDVRKLPMATLAASGALRRELPAVSTRELARLVQQSRALEDMQLVWMWLSPLLLLGSFVWFCVPDFDNANLPLDYMPLALGVGLCAARLILGHGRSLLGRYVGLLLDAVLVGGCVVAITLLTKLWFFGSFPEQIGWVLSTAVLSFPVLFGFHALVAMFEARGLFGPRRCEHRQLVEELNFRRELGIE